MWHGSILSRMFHFNLFSKTVIYLIIDLLAIDLILYKHSEQVYPIWLHVCLTSVTGAKILRLIFQLLIYDSQTREKAMIEYYADSGICLEMNIQTPELILCIKQTSVGNWPGDTQLVTSISA